MVTLQGALYNPTDAELPGNVRDQVQHVSGAATEKEN